MIEHMLDVSSNNHLNSSALFDWEKAKAAGYSMVYVKATQGTTYTNPYLVEDSSGAKDAGFLVGLYHFYGGGNPVNEADYFLSVVNKITADLLPVFDYETGTPTASVVEAFRSKTGAIPYYNRDFASALKLSYECWLAWPGWKGWPVSAYGQVAAVQSSTVTVPGLGPTDHTTVLRPATFHKPVRTLPAPIVGGAVCASGGYWLADSTGRVYAIGCDSFGSLDVKLERPIVGIIASRTGNGYYLVAGDGGVFAFGDAVYVNSLPGEGWQA